MANRVSLTIDGKVVQAPEGTNLIDAASLAGVHIPNLCYLKGMRPVGACRLCLVDVEGAKAPVIACNSKVKEGMKVVTGTEKIRETRKFIIDLILSMHPLDCMTCTKAGVCRLQGYAYDFGIKESTFTRKKFGYPTDEANPFIKRDPEYCILCSRCVRACKEQGTDVLEFMGRGVGAKVMTAGDRPLQESGCTFCGSCVDACPVNALLEADRWRKGREWDYETVNSVCLLCGNGCDITVSTKDGSVQKVNAGAVEGSVEKYICAYGRFGFDCIEADTRVTAPLKRVGGELKETTWEDALEIVAKKLKKGGSASSFITTAGILNEDALALKGLATALKSKNIATTASLYADAESLTKSQPADLDGADLIVLVGLNPSQWQRALPALDAGIRRRVSRGAKLIVINSSETKLSEAATLNLKGDEADILKGLAKAVVERGAPAEGPWADKALKAAVSGAVSSEEMDKAGEMFNAAKSPVIFASPALFGASANLTLIKGAAVAVPIESNARGVALMGLMDGAMTYKEMVSRGSMTLLYTIGEVPLRKRPGVDFLIVQNSHMTELATQADIVLPSAAFLESAGTMADYMGRLKYLPCAVEPQGEALPHRDIFIGLGKALGVSIKKPTEAEVKRAMKTKAKPSLSPFEKVKGLEVEPGELIESINASVINGSRLLWLKEAQPAAV